MTDEIITTLLQTYGSVGVVCVVAGYALRTLQTQLTDLQEKRVADALAGTAKLVELMASQHERDLLLAKAMDANADAIQAHRQQIESLIAERGYQLRPPAAGPRR
jgi:dihydrodipicolinate synthase/N-acetylneuraminate lyase